MFGDPREQAIVAALAAGALLFGQFIAPLMLHGAF